MGKRQDDDLGFRTGGGGRRPSGRGSTRDSSRKRETGKHRSAKKAESGKTKRSRESDRKPRKSVPAEPPLPRRSGGIGLKVPALAAGAAIALGAGLLALFMKEDAIEVVEAPPATAIVQIDDQPKPTGIKPTKVPVRSPLTVKDINVRVLPDQEPTEPDPPPKEGPKEDVLGDLASRSSTHAAIARLLEQFSELFSVEALHQPGPLFQDFRERQRREEELLEQIRAMGPVAVDALQDMLLELDHRQYRIFLGKALAGMEGSEARAAVQRVLSEVKDVALQTTLVRFLPETRESAETVAAALEDETNPNLRTMLLREYHRRLGQGDDSGRDVFREAALNDPDPNVRAEAVTILGRRGDPRDQDIMERIISNEQNLQIRQRAIVSYAETGRDASLDFLDNLARTPNTALAIRASAVLAIGRVGSEPGPARDRAIRSLDTLAQTDPSQEIRTRANRLAMSLRRRQQEAAENPNPQEPVRIGPSPEPLERQ